MKSHKILVEFTIKAKSPKLAAERVAQAIADGHNAIYEYVPVKGTGALESTAILGSCTTPKPRTVCVQINGGICQQVYGLRPGDTYTVADYDDDDNDPERIKENDALIEQAENQ